MSAHNLYHFKAIERVNGSKMYWLTKFWFTVTASKAQNPSSELIYSNSIIFPMPSFVLSIKIFSFPVFILFESICWFFMTADGSMLILDGFLRNNKQIFSNKEKEQVTLYK